MLGRVATTENKSAQSYDRKNRRMARGDSPYKPASSLPKPLPDYGRDGTLGYWQSARANGVDSAMVMIHSERREKLRQKSATYASPSSPIAPAWQDRQEASSLAA